ncbi:MAG: type II toxin-antitoxin system RelE/ParE family toxin [Syntrophobacteraceae bacterium]
MVRLPPPPNEKPLHWVGSSRKDFGAFPGTVQGNIGYALGVAQLGGKHPKAKPWKGLGPGVFEIVEDYEGNAFRVVFTVRPAQAVYVLHAFQKKSKSGIKTPKSDVDLVGKRLQLAMRHYEAQYGVESGKDKTHE